MLLSVVMRVSGDRPRRAEGRHDRLAADVVQDLVAGAVVAAVGEVGRLVGDASSRRASAELVSCSTARSQRSIAMKLFFSALRVAEERDRALPDQLVRVGAVLAIEPRPDGERAVRVVEGTGIRARDSR